MLVIGLGSIHSLGQADLQVRMPWLRSVVWDGDIYKLLDSVGTLGSPAQ